MAAAMSSPHPAHRRALVDAQVDGLKVFLKGFAGTDNADSQLLI
jgi:hypothetical protein